MFNNKIYIKIAVLASIFVNCVNSPAESSKNDCVDYWVNRTSDWQNRPSLEEIETSDFYCGL